MPIVSSSVVVDQPQADGRRQVREKHTDHLGGVHEFQYLAEANTDVEAVMLARVPTIEAQLRDDEVAEYASRIASGEILTPPFSFSTRRDLVVRLRELLRDSDNGASINIAGFISEVADDADLKAAFGNLTATQLSNLKTRLANRKALRDQVRAAVGE